MCDCPRFKFRRKARFVNKRSYIYKNKTNTESMLRGTHCALHRTHDNTYRNVGIIQRHMYMPKHYS